MARSKKNSEKTAKNMTLPEKRLAIAKRRHAKKLCVEDKELLPLGNVTNESLVDMSLFFLISDFIAENATLDLCYRGEYCWLLM